MIALQPQDKKQRLDYLKEQISGHFLAIGQYLAEIRDDKLYELDNQTSFSAWVVNVLGYSKTYASQHIIAYEQNMTIIDAGSLPFANITASRKLTNIIQDKQNIDAIAIAMLATEIAQEDNRETITTDDLNRAYQVALGQYPKPVQAFCERFNISNPDKVKLITEWFYKGAGRDDSKWSSMEYSGKLIINYPDSDDLILDLSTCTVADMASFAKEWANYAKKIADDAYPKKEKYSGFMRDIIKKLFAYRNKTARVVVYFD